MWCRSPESKMFCNVLTYFVYYIYGWCCPHCSRLTCYLFYVYGCYHIPGWYWVYDAVCFSSKSSRVSTPDSCPVGHWHFLHSMVFCVWSYKHEIHQGHIQRTFGGPCCCDLLRIWNFIPAPLGWNLCMIRQYHKLLKIFTVDCIVSDKL